MKLSQCFPRNRELSRSAFLGGKQLGAAALSPAFRLVNGGKELLPLIILHQQGKQVCTESGALAAPVVARGAMGTGFALAVRCLRQHICLSKCTVLISDFGSLWAAHMVKSHQGFCRALPTRGDQGVAICPLGGESYTPNPVRAVTSQKFCFYYMWIWPMRPQFPYHMDKKNLKHPFFNTVIVVLQSTWMNRNPSGIFFFFLPGVGFYLVVLLWEILRLKV